MPTIVFVSPKGGAGKTTAALILATQIAREAPVSIIDADPNHPILNWSKGNNVPPSLTVISDVDENTIADRIDEASTQTPFVIVDLEGTAAKIVVLAVARADFVIVPTQGSQLDAEQASRALKVIRDQESSMRRVAPNYVLPYSVLLTRTNSAIRTKTLRHIHKGLIDAGIPVFKSELNEREAFRGMFSFKQTLENLSTSDVANLDKAIINAETFTKEVIDVLRVVMNKGA